MNKKSKAQLIKKTFIDKNFGDYIEYIFIKDKEKRTLVYGKNEEITILRLRNMDHLIQELIMLKEERDFLLEENFELLEQLEKEQEKNFKDIKMEV